MYIIQYELLKLGLNPKQARIAVLVSEGLSNIEISLKVGLTPKGVTYHVTRISRKLDCWSRPKLISKIINMKYSVNSLPTGIK